MAVAAAAASLAAAAAVRSVAVENSSSRAEAVAEAAAKFQFYRRVSEVTLGPSLGFLGYVLGTKLGGVLLFRMCFEKGVWLFASCFGAA